MPPAKKKLSTDTKTNIVLHGTGFFFVEGDTWLSLWQNFVFYVLEIYSSATEPYEEFSNLFLEAFLEFKPDLRIDFHS